MIKKDEIERLAYQRLSQIEERFSHLHVPFEIQAYWLLNFIISEGFTSYFSSYGLMPIDLGDANDGRQELGLGQLSLFERDVLSLLEERIDQAESSQKPSFV